MPRRRPSRSAHARPGGPLRNPSPANRRRLYILTEGERTEVQYLQEWLRRYRDTVLATIDDRHGMGPKQLVGLASQKKRWDQKLARRGKQDPFDEYWCVGDVDEHENVHGALEQAEQNGIRVALSSPCIELWLLLHLQDQTAYIDRYDAQRLVRQSLGCGKNLTHRVLDVLLDRHEDAVKRVHALASKHEREGSDHYANPSSTVWQLVDSIRDQYEVG